MKPKIARATLMVISIATLCMSASLAAQADDRCSTAKAAGDWAVTLAGTLILPTGPVPGAALATLNVDEAGNISGTEARNVGGGFANETITGMWTVNPDCTGSGTAYIYESGQLVRTSVLSIAFDDNVREIRMIQQSLALPDGTQVPVVITVEGKRLFSHGHERDRTSSKP